ncbi:hypothetical protein ACUNV4_06375 [Granulosicoccus sp. 3-233]|uniref:hypothetical protein n=1 Tax=Granulosicoccus sp. 3-233 TaxID=3417969 RepID=UPI003D337A51
MRPLLPLALIVTCATAVWLIAVQNPAKGTHWLSESWGERDDPAYETLNGALSGVTGNSSRERLLAIEPYEDLDYGFKVAIPVGWRKIVTADSISAPVSGADSTPGGGQEAVSSTVPLSLEPGYAVGFESVQENPDDRFADYILIEVLPGGESGTFDADRSQRRPVTIDGRQTWFDRIEIDQASSGLIDVDLVVYQAEVSGVGYTVGLYAIGEPVREQLLAMAFEIMLRTFRIIRDPFTVS